MRGLEVVERHMCVLLRGLGFAVDKEIRGQTFALTVDCGDL
jgi:hypothetical protein